MTREEAQAVIKALVTLRENATDEQALKAPAIYPKWKENKEYKRNNGKLPRVLYKEVLYQVLQEHTSQADWTPDVATSLFAKVLIPNDSKIYDWEQPNSTNPYTKGDKVMYEGKIWISDIDNNVWKPGEYGWSEYTE